VQSWIAPDDRRHRSGHSFWIKEDAQQKRNEVAWPFQISRETDNKCLWIGAMSATVVLFPARTRSIDVSLRLNTPAIATSAVHPFEFSFETILSSALCREAYRQIEKTFCKRRSAVERH
jgi:hypothetical protein